MKVLECFLSKHLIQEQVVYQSGGWSIDQASTVLVKVVGQDTEARGTPTHPSNPVQGMCKFDLSIPKKQPCLRKLKM